jgi:hypothetical protein
LTQKSRDSQELIGRGWIAQQRDHFFVIDKDCECGQSQVLVAIHNEGRAN